MIDKTTAGYSAVPDEVEAVLHNLCGYHLSERDPLLRYEALTREQVLYDALVSAIRRERGRAVAEIIAAGHKITHVAEMTRLGTRQRVQRLISIAKAAEDAAVEAAAVAEAAAAEARVARSLGAAVISSVRDLADEGGFAGEYALAGPGFESAYDGPGSGSASLRADQPAESGSLRAAQPTGSLPETPLYEALAHEAPVYDVPAYPAAAMYEAAAIYEGEAGYEDEADYEDEDAADYASLPVRHQRADRSRFDSELVPEYDADPRFAGEYDDVDPDVVLEPTMMMPTIVEPTREVKQAGEASWWRRGRDSTARSA